MKTLLLIVSIAIILVVLLAVYGCLVMSSKCSREEEKKRDMQEIERITEEMAR